MDIPKIPHNEAVKLLVFWLVEMTEFPEVDHPYEMLKLRSY